MPQVDRVNWRNLEPGCFIPDWGTVAQLTTDGLVVAPSDPSTPDGLLIPLASRFGDYRFNGVIYPQKSDLVPYDGQSVTIEELIKLSSPTEVVSDWDAVASAFGPWPERYQGARISYFDTETTGFDPETGDRIIEIACTVIEESGIVFEWSSLINPQRKIPAASTNIHGITDEMVRSAPLDGEVIETFLEIIGDSDYISAHNLDFDRKFLQESVVRNGLEWPKGKRALDTLTLARDLIPRGNSAGKTPNHRLGTLVTFFEIEQGTAHRAAYDSRVGALLLNELLKIKCEREAAAATLEA